MKNISLRAAGLLVAFLAGAVAVAPHAHAESRAGTIEAIQPIENRGDDTSERTKRGRTWGERLGKFGGLAAGVGLSSTGHTKAGYVTTSVASAGGDKIGRAVGERIAGEGPTTRYMVKVRLDKGRVLSLTQLRKEMNGLGVGSRVIVEGSGDEAKLQAVH